MSDSMWCTIWTIPVGGEAVSYAKDRLKSDASAYSWKLKASAELSTRSPTVFQQIYDFALSYSPLKEFDPCEADSISNRTNFPAPDVCLNEEGRNRQSFCVKNFMCHVTTLLPAYCKRWT